MGHLRDLREKEHVATLRITRNSGMPARQGLDSQFAVVYGPIIVAPNQTVVPEMLSDPLAYDQSITGSSDQQLDGR